jgi:hypothetical protein
MPTGNGQGFSIFDRQQDRITYFLEHPYRYVAPGNDMRTFGIGRRNLAHDVYFGARIGGASTWINKCGSSDCTDYASVEYENQSNIIHGSTSFHGANIDTYAFAPYGYAGNALVMLIQVTNMSGSAIDASVFLKPNLALGQGRVDPANTGESITWVTGGMIDHSEETGPGGGHALYIPIGKTSHASCGADSAMYQAVLGGGAIGDVPSCTGDNQVPLLQQDLHVAPMSSGWWGTAILFDDDNPADPRANLFSDPRSTTDIVTLWGMFAGMRSPQQVHDDALAEWESWRKNTAPAQLNDTEKKLWRQSEAVLRQGQILEYNSKNYGMVIASLPPGEWHTGWVRDGTYAISALSMTGHYDEAKKALEFDIGAKGGFFNQGYLNRDYRVSVCRFFGDGEEEGDFNQDGPNIETDGWGLVLWGARMYLNYSCDRMWLDKMTWQGDTVYSALKQIATDIESTMSMGLPGGDASIWEVHWGRRQVFAYTAAAHIRGLFDFADIAHYYGDKPTGDHFAMVAQAMLDKAKTALAYQPTMSMASNVSVAGQDVHVDGSTVGFFDWHLIKTNDPLYVGTLNSFSRLVTGFGGYRRVEPMLDLTGSGGASPYDLSEWILLDIRIADAWRRAGYELMKPDYVAKSEQLLGKVTQNAAVNDFLIPELYDPSSGVYAGQVPMNGYGAGAWIMSQLEKYGSPQPGYGDALAQCTDPCFSRPCHDPHKGQCTAMGTSFSCGCDPGFHDSQGSCAVDDKCTPTTCAGHGMCNDTSGVVCACDMGYAGAHCDGCASGFNQSMGACTMIAGTGGQMMGGQIVFNDGAASLCEIRGSARPWDALFVLSILVASILAQRYRRRRAR